MEARSYWRGPVWPVADWLLWWSLVRADELERAGGIRRVGLKRLASNGFAEYFEPFTGEPLALPTSPGRPPSPRIGSPRTTAAESSLRDLPRGCKRVAELRVPLDPLVGYLYIRLYVLWAIGGDLSHPFGIQPRHVRAQDENALQQRLRLLLAIPGRKR